MKTEEVDMLLSIREVAETLSVSTKTVKRYKNRNPNFPKPVEMGRRMHRWRASDLQRYIDALPKKAS